MQKPIKNSFSLKIQNQELLLDNSSNVGGFVTSLIHNLTINHKKNRIPFKFETKITSQEWNSLVKNNAFSRMSIKSLKNIYAITGL